VATNDKVLIEIVTAANLAGVEEAKASFLGMSASLLALTAVLGAVIVIGKAAIENYEAQQTALLGLEQATKATGQNYDKVKAAVQGFIDTNKQYISNQYDVISAAALITRAGNNETDMLRILNDALDLATIKHEDVSVAAKSLILAEAGNAKALKELGITTAEYNAIMKSKETQEQKDQALLTLIESKTKDGRKATTELSGAQSALNIDWQNFTARIGPGVVNIMTQLYTAADTAVQILDLADQAVVKLGQDAKNPVWGRLQDFLILISGKPVRDGVEALLAVLGQGGAAGGAPRSGGQAYYGGKAAGGPVTAGGAYTVGENGPETLVLGSQGGSIIPNGSSGAGVHYHFHIGTLVSSAHAKDQFMNELLRSARVRPGT